VTVYSDNAAGRLHQLITSFRQNATPHPVTQHAIPNAWAAALGSGVIDGPDFLRRLAFAFRLPGEIEREIDKIDQGEYDADLAMRWRGPAFLQAFGSSLFSGETSAQIAEKFDEASLSSLEYCSYVLHRHRPQQVFTDSDLERIRALIGELRAELEGDIGPDDGLREFLQFHADAMAHALDDLALRGPAALEDTFDQAVGAAQRRMDLSARSGESRSAWRKFGELVVTVAAVLQITTSSLALPGLARQGLEGPPPAAQAVVEVVVPQEPGPPAVPVPAEHPNGSRSAPAADGARDR